MARRTKKPIPHDPYWDVVQSLMQNILTIYEMYREKKPVMLFDMQEQRIYVYPYLDFKHDLSERSQRLLQDQYEQAMTDDKIVVFVRDNDARKLVFKYDRKGDILNIDKVPPYAEQETEELGDDVIARLNPITGEIENLEVLFFSTRLLRSDLFALPVTAELHLIGRA